MIRVIEEEGAVVFWGDVPGIVDALGRLPEKYAMERQRLTELLGTIKRN